MYLTMKDLNHTETVFTQFLVEYGEDICPGGGEIWYLNGRVQCERHPGGVNEDYEDDGGGTVPFL